jgi:site-specific recombinase XerC
LDDEDEHFFLGQRGLLQERGMQMRLAALGDEVGLKVTPHVLRHTFATRRGCRARPMST